MAKKPSPKMLGAGMARKAANALGGRRRQLDAAIEEAEGGRKATKKVPSKYKTKR